MGIAVPKAGRDDHPHSVGERDCPLELTEAQAAELDAQLEAWRASRGKLVTGGVIDVYVHVINQGDAAADGNLSSEAIAAQIEHLNKAYAQTGWSFRIQELERTTNPAWYSSTGGSATEREMKTALHKGEASDLNLYLLSPSSRGLMGWATFPNWYEGREEMDGVVINNRSLPGGPIRSRNEGDTLVHEVGHWMGLLHTFQGGCPSPGDRVDDTAAEASPFPGFEAGRDSCVDDPGPDPVYNYMDYSYDVLRSEFTKGQNARIDEMFSAFRQNESSPRNEEA
jgi:hypothetical protein